MFVIRNAPKLESHMQHGSIIHIQCVQTMHIYLTTYCMYSALCYTILYSTLLYYNVAYYKRHRPPHPPGCWTAESRHAGSCLVVRCCLFRCCLFACLLDCLLVYLLFLCSVCVYVCCLFLLAVASCRTEAANSCPHTAEQRLPANRSY